MNSQLKQQFQKIRDLLNEASTILIATHEKPDGDGIGASLALFHALNSIGKDCFCFCPDFLPDYLKFLPGSEGFTNLLPRISPGLILALDYGKYERLGDLCQINEVGEDKFISIDHHPFQDQQGKIKIILPDFSSTSEIIYQFLKESNYEISQAVAICLLTGIFTDTGGFRHAVTSPGVLQIVGSLLGRGANLAEIAGLLSEKRSLPALKIRGLILSRIRYDKEADIAYSWISQKDFRFLPVNFEDIEGLPEVINSISDCRTALFMSEDEPQNIYCSLRSEPFKNVNVSKIAEYFGGGGHPYAAGFRFQGTLKEALESVKRVVKDTILAT